MQEPEQVRSKKRTLAYMHSQDLAGKLKSKQDFLVYLDKHRKYRLTLLLTHHIV